MRPPIALVALLATLAAAGMGSSNRFANRTSVSANDTVTLAFEIRQLPSDSTPRVEFRLTLPPSRDSVSMLMLTDEWAGQQGLYKGILELAAETPGARIEAGDEPRLRRLIAPPNTRVTIRWMRRPSWSGVMPRNGHNVSDFGSDWMQLIGYDALVLPARELSTPVRATIAFRGLPAGAVVATSFGSGALQRDTLVTARTRFEALLHAVYTVGTKASAVRLYTFPLDGRKLHVAVRGALSIPDSAMVATVRQVVTAERAFFNDRGPPEYLVTVGQASRGTLAGTRLTDSFVADIDPARPSADVGVVTLLGHELMHEWLGGALHPAANAAGEHLIWFTEGFTDYLSQQILWKAGLINDSAYVAHLNASLHDYAMSPARDLSWAEVERQHWTDPVVQRQPYLRGELFALRVDALARQSATSGAGRRGAPQSVGSAIVAMLTANRGRPVLLTESTIETGLAPVLGLSRLRQELRAIVPGARIEIPSNLLGPCVAQNVVDENRWDPGFDLDGSIAAKAVRGVRAGGRAAAAGLKDSMPLRGYSVYRGDVTRPMDLRIRMPGDTADRHIIYQPLGDTTEKVVRLSLEPGCNLKATMTSRKD